MTFIIKFPLKKKKHKQKFITVLMYFLEKLLGY